MMLMARNATPEQKVRRHVALSAGVTALGGLLFGYDTGVVSGALLFLQKDFGGLSSFQEELVTSLLLVGAVVGALLAGRVADLIGRRLTVLITAAIFVVGVLLAAFTPTYPVLLVARIVIGLAVGSASMVVPLYIGEVVPPRVRGGLVSLNQLAITSGILVSYLIDYGLSGTGNWRLMFGLAAIPAVLLFAGMLFQKESPHWLIRQDRTACAFLGGEHLHGALAIVAVLGLLIYTGSFAIGLGPVFWLLIAEIYPLRIRGAAMSVATMANWGANFVVTVSFLTLLNAINGVGVFFLFGFLTLIALAYFWRKVPETKGRSLQQIEHELTGSKA
jgi:MFS family permease